jgi:hypothetical protein
MAADMILFILKTGLNLKSCLNAVFVESITAKIAAMRNALVLLRVKKETILKNYGLTVIIKYLEEDTMLA